MTPEYLDQFVGILKSSVGGCFPGEKAIFRNHNLHTDLNDIKWFDLYMFSILNRRLKKNELLLLQTLWSYTSYPDSRIWNNRVAALAGTTRSTTSLGLASALSISESNIFGRGIDFKTIHFLITTQKKVTQKIDLYDCIKEELEKNRGIAGYGRPLTSKDERIDPTIKKAQSLGLAEGPHLKLAFDIDHLLTKKRWRLKINYAAISAALAADIGLSATEYYQYAFLAFIAGMTPCYIEASEKPAGTLFPTPCSGLDYQGKEKRSWDQRKTL